LEEELATPAKRKGHGGSDDDKSSDGDSEDNGRSKKRSKGITGSALVAHTSAHDKALVEAEKGDKGKKKDVASVSFLKTKTAIKIRMEHRLSKPEGKKGGEKKLKKVQTKVDGKTIEVSDLPFTTQAIVARMKIITNEMKALKKKLPTLRKTDIPAVEKQLDNTEEDYTAIRRANIGNTIREKYEI